MPLHLPSLITLRRPADAELSPEDIFSSSLGGIFTDDMQNQHGDGDEGTVIVYRNARFGDLEFRTADVSGEEQRRKFAHYLWNAGVLMGELVGGRGEESGSAEDGRREWWVDRDEEPGWSVEGHRVLELGAGAWNATATATIED
jgi:hypothetical protein